MIICTDPKPFPYLKIRNFYNPEELRLIWQELDFLTHYNKMNPPEQTGQKGPHMKHNVGLFLDELYRDRKYSNILGVNRKLFSEEVVNAYTSLHITYNTYRLCNFDTTLVSYYENSSYYKSHHDLAVATSVTWIFKEPKKFKGGDFIFSQFNEKIEVENNMTVIFPSCMLHEVTSIEMDISAIPYDGNGRYCLSNFVLFKGA